MLFYYFLQLFYLLKVFITFTKSALKQNVNMLLKQMLPEYKQVSYEYFAHIDFICLVKQNILQTIHLSIRKEFSRRLQITN